MLKQNERRCSAVAATLDSQQGFNRLSPRTATTCLSLTVFFFVCFLTRKSLAEGNSALANRMAKEAKEARDKTEKRAEHAETQVIVAEELCWYTVLSMALSTGQVLTRLPTRMLEQCSDSDRACHKVGKNHEDGSIS